MPNVVAIIHPNLSLLSPKFPNCTASEICADRAAKTAVFQDIARIGKIAGIKNFEKVTGIKLVESAFTVENGLLTATGKISRHTAKKQFRREIRKLYQENLNNTI
jgi:long-subunit acyl-CoA synthetase (AMP-forming)